MQVILAQISDYFWGAWRFRWLMLALVWLISIAGWIWVATIPEQYLATARIYVDTNSILRPLLKGLTVQPDLTQRTALVSRTLLSRPNLEKLMRMTDLDLQVNSEQDKEDLFTKLSKKISLTGDRRNRSLYTASFKHKDRDTAKLMVQSLISVFTESALGSKRMDSTEAQTFIERQIADYEVRLKEAETRMVNFKQRNAAVLNGGVGKYYERLQETKNSASEVRLQLSEMENRRAELEQQLEDDQDEDSALLYTGMDEIQSNSPLDLRIQSLQEKLDRLSLRYTGRHPEMIQLKSMISELKLKKRKNRSGPSKNTPELLNNPVYQQKQNMLAETEATIAELKVRAEEYDKRAKELEAKVNEVPEVEARLKQLNRDYGAISAQHAKLLQRRESAFLSEDMEEGASTIKFRVIDPPFVPLKPTEPNKLLLNTGVFFAAIIASMGIVFLLSLLYPVFHNRRTLRQATGLPVLGCVTFIPSPDQERKTLIGGLVYASLALFLVLAFVGVNMSQDILSI
ncbi:MAG TPA: chain length-determining protein [Gammaproteobacteria bacterium]|nr:chain length-determining protein [Gammaproteobacteria bacterium]